MAALSRPAPDIDSLANELRSISASHGGHMGRRTVYEFAERHRLSHCDVDRLLAALDQDELGSIEQGADSTSVDEPRQTVVDLADEPVSGDVAWIFGDEPELTVLRSADDVVGQASDDLLGDWLRKGERLAQADVALLVSKRGLSPLQHHELLERLADAGVELDDFAPLRRRHDVRTRHYHDAVGQYLKALASYPLIDGPREIELWSLISQGVEARDELNHSAGDGSGVALRRGLQAQVERGRRAHSELVCANLRLVVSIAKLQRYESSGVELLDRIQDGNCGLMRAANKFDGSKGFKFSTYATWWIRQSIERGIGDRGRLIRIPVHMHEKAQKVRKAVRDLTGRFGREPELAEISDETHMEPGEVQALLDLGRPVISLDGLLGVDGDLRLSDVLAAEDCRDGRTDPAQIAVHTLMREDLIRALRSRLSPREVQVLERRYGVGTGNEETLEAIGASLGVTRERIRQIEKVSFAKLSKSKCTTSLRSYIMDDSRFG